MIRSRISFLALIVLLSSSSFAAVFVPGETITYQIKKANLTVGKVIVRYHGITPLEGRDYILVTVDTAALRMRDTEKIYLDPQSFYPAIIERDIDMWGKKESITERYREDGYVRIIKVAKGKREAFEIKKPQRLDNIYAFIYRYRVSGQFKPGEKLEMTLPTKDVMIGFAGREKIEAVGQEHETYYLEGNDKDYQIWFDTTERRIPLRIKGSVGFGKTSLVMESYAP
ncbi:MAG TPA: DUF3108 domain-containing protein [Candidatus Omnitrophota bacterium]|nr:DUF3108 domain-containing protein [Candidatus Omnitrophota bacterium]